MKRATLYLTALVCVSGMASEGLMAAEPSGRAIAATCNGCHGPDGMSVGTVPSLAGRDAKFTEQQMQDFKSGKRPATIMGRIAKGYNDEELAAVSEYYSKVK